MGKFDIKKYIGHDKKLINFAWPGGYPVYYFDKDNETLCPACANKERKNLIAADVHYEGPPIVCAECNKEIESAYGDPDAGKD